MHRDLSDLVRRIDSIVEGEPPRVYPLGERVVIEGPVDDLDTLEQVALVSRIFDEEFVNLMSVRGDHQVQLEVMFAEVSRTATRELGLNVLYGDRQWNGVLIGPTTGVTAFANPLTRDIFESVSNPGFIPTPVQGGMTLGGYSQPLNIAALIGTLDDHRLGKILAQPAIISLSGQKADFLSGGEIPIPTPQGGGAGGTTITIQFKEYGIKLWFIPTVLASDVIDVQMYLEISEPDFAVATRVAGIDVPGFVSRKSQSHLRLENGMTFAVAGLLSDNVSYTRIGVPGLGRIPLLGSLFPHGSPRAGRDRSRHLRHATAGPPARAGRGARGPRHHGEQQPKRLRVVHSGNGPPTELPHGAPDWRGRATAVNRDKVPFMVRAGGSRRGSYSTVLTAPLSFAPARV